MHNTTTINEILEYVRENDVKFIKLTFCDMLGRQRNISVLSSQLEDAYEHGVAIDSGAMTGVGGLDLKLMPVPLLLSDLPWRPHSGKVVSIFCKLGDIDCKPYPCDPMALLERRVAELSALGYSTEVATECEFYVFKDEDDKLEPIDDADYCACFPFDKCENLRRDVILSLEELGLKPISAHHERGRGQNEVDFERADPMSAVRNFIMFKSAVKNVCMLNGTRASFMPKPMADQPGSGLHLSITLSGKDSAKASGAFAEGVLRRYKEITCFANPTANSYERLHKPYAISHSPIRGAAMRIFGDNNNIIQLRTPDSTSNLFTVLSLVYAAGREGIEKGYKLRKADESGGVIFSDVKEAIEFAKSSKWLHEQIPDKLDDILGSMTKRYEAERDIKNGLDRFKLYADV